MKDAFWKAGSQHDFKELVEKMETNQTMRPIDPASLVKLVTGAVEFAKSYGFSPHPDYRHASRLLAGIDPLASSEEFTYGRNGKPFYVQGPFESSIEATAIIERLHAAGGHFLVGGPQHSISDLTEGDPWNHLESFADDADNDLDLEQIEDSSQVEPGEVSHSDLPSLVHRDGRSV